MGLVTPSCIIYFELKSMSSLECLDNTADVIPIQSDVKCWNYQVKEADMSKAYRMYDKGEMFKNVLGET
jgi:hypothetical protein